MKLRLREAAAQLDQSAAWPPQAAQDEEPLQQASSSGAAEEEGPPAEGALREPATQRAAAWPSKLEFSRCAFGGGQHECMRARTYACHAQA